MGLFYSYMYLDTEQKSWVEHDLKFDEAVRQTNLERLELIEDGVDLYLSHLDKKFGGIAYQHWFVTDRTHFIEFDCSARDQYGARVIISTREHNRYPLDLLIPMNDDIRQRIRHVLGMSNYSMCLRNCEHVAKYILLGRWVSDQMQSGGPLMNYFGKHLEIQQNRHVNSFPSAIQPHVFSAEAPTLYSFIDAHFNKPQGIEYYLDYDSEDYNILVIGPTGAGKSRLINVLFNREICTSETSLGSVTRDVCFVRGRGRVYDTEKKTFVDNKIVVADTIGLCDSKWDNNTVLSLIQGRVSYNIQYIDVVYVVFKAAPLQSEFVESIKTLLDWLGYINNRSRFRFVVTFTENVTDEQKKKLKEEAMKFLGITQDERANFEPIVYTTFRSVRHLVSDDDRAQVKDSLKQLKEVLEMKFTSPRLHLQRTSCTIM